MTRIRYCLSVFVGCGRTWGLAPTCFLSQKAIASHLTPPINYVFLMPFDITSHFVRQKIVLLPYCSCSHLNSLHAFWGHPAGVLTTSAVSIASLPTLGIKCGPWMWCVIPPERAPCKLGMARAACKGRLEATTKMAL